MESSAPWFVPETGLLDIPKMLWIEKQGGGGGGTCQQKSNCPRDFDAVRYASKLKLDDAIAPRNSLPIRGSGGANHGRSQSKKGAHAERLETKIETKKRTTL